MMEDLLWRDKRGVSLMIGYVLLIIIAIGLSVAVFAYLQLYLPKDKAQCFDGVSLSIDNLKCEGGVINITIANRGLFTVDGVFIRIGDKGRIFRTNLNEADNFAFLGEPDGKLLPGIKWNKEYGYLDTGLKEVELEPFLYIEGESVLCEKAIVSQNVDCVP